MLYGCRLNRFTRVSASACNAKPLSNIVEAHITWETRGVWPFPHKTAPRKGTTTKQMQPAGCFFPPNPEKRNGSPERTLWELAATRKIAVRNPIAFARYRKPSALRSRKAEKEPLDSSFEIGIYFSKQENEKA